MVPPMDPNTLCLQACLSRSEKQSNVKRRMEQQQDSLRLPTLAAPRREFLAGVSVSACRTTVRYIHGMDRPKQTKTVPKSLVPREQELALVWQGPNLATVRKEQHSSKEPVLPRLFEDS